MYLKIDLKFLKGGEVEDASCFLHVYMDMHIFIWYMRVYWTATVWCLSLPLLFLDLQLKSEPNEMLVHFFPLC